ncbi:hypothetical protein HMI55_000661 [Coelomomyces lativittatus]|nr:hypothetical protein HMI55_000661 [Coelomomyces lativittatus]
MKATSLRKRASDGDIELHRKRIELESEFIQDFKEKVLRKLEDLDRQLHRMKLEYLVIRDSRVSASHDYSVQNRMAMLEEEINRAVQEFFTNQEPNTLKKVSSEVHQKPPSNPPPKISTPSLPLSSSPIRDQAPSVTAARSSPDSQLKHKRSKRAVITPEMQVLPDLMPIFPIYVGVFKVLSLGVVCLEPGYHTERYIYPIGYSIQRQFQSSLHKDSQTTYTCSILQGEPGQGPVFDVISEDNPGGRVSGTWFAFILNES